LQFSDIDLSCRECGSGFLFTAGEQDYYIQKGLQNIPARCPECRRKRWEQANIGVEPTALPRTVPEVTAVSCAECGQPTTVPFKPKQNLPVFCKGCYLKRKEKMAMWEQAAAGKVSATG
jgi:CxxC-x17-CxxC domain-containing protein